METVLWLPVNPYVVMVLSRSSIWSAKKQPTVTLRRISYLRIHKLLPELSFFYNYQLPSPFYCDNDWTIQKPPFPGMNETYPFSFRLSSCRTWAYQGQIYTNRRSGSWNVYQITWLRPVLRTTQRRLIPFTLRRSVETFDTQGVVLRYYIQFIAYSLE